MALNVNRAPKISALSLAAFGWLVPLLGQATSSTLTPPFGTASTQQEPVFIIATIIQVLLGFVGAATLLVFIWGGFNLIFSGGEAEKINKARSTLLWAVIGLAIILSSYAILQYTFSAFQTASGGG